MKVFTFVISNWFYIRTCVLFIFIFTLMQMFKWYDLIIYDKYNVS